jgi:hypothetical protein
MALAQAPREGLRQPDSQRLPGVAVAVIVTLRTNSVSCAWPRSSDSGAWASSLSEHPGDAN